MMRALLRKTWADIGSQKLQYSLIGAMLLMATMMLTIALSVQQSADGPWDRTFAETNGPHAWLVSSHYDLDFSPVLAHEAVTETSGPITTVADHPLIIDGEKYDIFLYAMAERPPVARPSLAQGRWLQAETPDEIVLDFSLANYYGLAVGDSVAVLTAVGARPLAIVGLAVTAHWFPYDDNTKDLAPGVGYISPATLAAIEPDSARWLKVLGLRLREPAASQAFVEEAHHLLGNQLLTSLEWQWLRQMATFSNRLNVLFLTFFSLLGLAAVGFIIANNIGGQVLAQYREIGLLKAIGFKPGQVTLLFLLEHLAVAIPATLLGLALGLAVAPIFTSPIAELLNSAPTAAFDSWLLLFIFLTIQGAVVLFTLAPAWHGGRIDTAQALTVGFAQTHHRASLLARLAGRLRLPPVVVLGVKDVFSRPLRTTITIIGLLLAIQVAVFAIGSVATVAKLGENRVYFQGTPADMRLTRNFVPDAEVRALLAGQSEISSYYSELIFYGWGVENRNEPIIGRALGDQVADFDFYIQEGRMFRAPGEAVAGAGLMSLLHLELGDEVTLLIGGQPLTVTIVGRHMEINNIGRLLLISLESYRQQIDPTAVPQMYGLALTGAADPAALQQRLMAATAGQFTVQIVDAEPNASVAQLQDIMVSLSVVLLLIAGVNLLSTSLLSVRERIRDFGVQKTLGLTPAQIAGSVMTGVCVMALIAVLLGIPLGLLGYNSFMAFVSEEVGAGAGFAQMDWLLLLLFIPGAIIVAVVSSVLPAQRAARIEVTEALRYE